MTAPIKFGLAIRNFAPHPEPLEVAGIVSYAQLAERAGFHSLWVWDHVLLGSKRPFGFLESLSVLSALAMATREVSLGTGVLVLPLRNPVVLAKVTSTIDHLSQGRLILGVASGWYEREFEACGVPFRERGRLFVRNVDVLTRLWTEERVHGSADDMEFRNSVMVPRPVQEPRPALLFGGYVDAVLRRTARMADGWLTYFYRPDSFARAWKKIRGYADEAGRDPDSLVNVAQLPICVDDSFERADARVRDFIDRYFDVAPWSESTADSAIRGAPEQCAEQIAEHVEAGVQHVVLVPVDYEESQVEAIAEGVLTRFVQADRSGFPA